MAAKLTAENARVKEPILDPKPTQPQDRIILMDSSSTTIPNLYTLSGHGLQITYSTSSFEGKPQLQYNDPFQTVQFSGDEIRTLTSEIGALVTVTIRRTIDSGSTSFTLIVPQVNLDQSNQAHIRTFGITTLHRFSIVPALNKGQTQLYTITELSGTAAAVAF